MKVIYDISVLGYGQYDQRGRTGIFRATERVAGGLARAPECDLSLAASRFPLSTIDYWASSKTLRDVRFLYPAFKKHVCIGLCRLNTSVRRAGTGLRRDLLLRGLRSLLYRTGRLTGAFAEPAPLPVPADADIFHSAFYPLPEETKRLRRVRRFLTVYDLTPILHPHFFAHGEDEMLNAILRSLSSQDWVLCISESCRDDLCRHTKVDPARVFVTPLAADAGLFHPCEDPERRARAREKYGIPDRPYLLSLGSLRPHKNSAHLVRCFGTMIRQERIDDLHLVLVGASGWEEGPLLAAIDDLGPLRERVIVTGYVADEDLAPLYSGATAFVYPSFYEGFGLPPLEAMQCGVPVITSNTSSLPEVVGEAGFMVDPADPEALCGKMLAVCRDGRLREEMARKSLDRARQFSWERCVTQTIEAYKTARAERR